jgi:hypothetical protein
MGAVQRPVRRLFHLPALPQRLTRGAVPAPPSTRADDLQERLAVLVRRSASLMRALRAVRVLDPPDWLIGAGAIRDRVWDSLHRAVPPPPASTSTLRSTTRRVWAASVSAVCRAP